AGGPARSQRASSAGRAVLARVAEWVRVSRGTSPSPFTHALQRGSLQRRSWIPSEIRVVPLRCLGEDLRFTAVLARPSIPNIAARSVAEPAPFPAISTQNVRYQVRMP